MKRQKKLLLNKLLKQYKDQKDLLNENLSNGDFNKLNSMIAMIEKKLNECLLLMDQMDRITRNDPNWKLQHKGYTKFVIKNQMNREGWHNYKQNLKDYQRDRKNYTYRNYIR